MYTYIYMCVPPLYHQNRIADPLEKNYLEWPEPETTVKKTKFRKFRREEREEIEGP